MSSTVFIDGAVGTTGLEIVDRLSGRSEFTLLLLDDDQRKQDGGKGGPVQPRIEHLAPHY